MSQLRKVGVFCASNLGASSVYEKETLKVADYLVEHQLELVYGGACVGLMGVLANRVLQRKGTAIGVIPEFLIDKEIAHTDLTELYVVSSMHARKQKIAEMVDAFVILPGGFGSVEEFFEMCTWKQLALHNKPCALLNINHFYDPLIEFIKHAVNQKFIKQEHYNLIIIESEIERLFQRMNEVQPLVDKWIFERESV